VQTTLARLSAGSTRPRRSSAGPEAEIAADGTPPTLPLVAEQLPRTIHLPVVWREEIDARRRESIPSVEARDGRATLNGRLMLCIFKRHEDCLTGRLPDLATVRGPLGGRPRAVIVRPATIRTILASSTSRRAWLLAMGELPAYG
jgi:hypothetical protein